MEKIPKRGINNGSKNKIGGAMNRHETNKTNMCKKVDNLFKAEPDVLTEYPVFVESLTRLSGGILLIETTDKKYLSAMGGKTTTKTNAEDELLEDLMPVKAALYSLGVKSGNEELKALTKPSEAELKKMRDADFLKKAEEIKAEAAKRLSELALYKITEATLTELQSKIDAFNAGLGGQDTGSSSKSALRKELDRLFYEVDKIFEEELDQLIELLRKSNKLFYDKYWSARGIDDLGGGKKGSGDAAGNSQTPTEPTK
jgi:hypothetical protein